MLGGARMEELGNFRAPLQHNDLIWRQNVAQHHFLLKSRICCPKIWPVGFQNISPAKFHFGILIILNCRYLKNSKCRKRISLNSPHLPEDRSSKRNSIVINSLLGRFINQGELIYHRRQEVNTTPRKTLSQTILPLLYSSQGPLIFLKNHLLSPNRPTSWPLPLP